MSRIPENFRGLHSRRLLPEVENLTLDGLIELAYSPLVPAFEELIPGVVRAYDQSSNKHGVPAEAIEVLRDWDFTTGTESVAMTIAHFYGMNYMRNGKAPSGLNMIERFSYYGNKAPFKERLEILKTTLDQIEKDFGTWNIAWGEVNRFQRLDGSIQPHFDDNQPSLPVGFASGRWGALASYGARTYDTKKLYGTSGNSFVAVVEFGEKVKAKSILAGGQSGDPNSPHFYDQAQPYIDVDFKDVAYYKEDVEARAKETYKPGKRN